MVLESGAAERIVMVAGLVDAVSGYHQCLHNKLVASGQIQLANILLKYAINYAVEISNNSLVILSYEHRDCLMQLVESFLPVLGQLVPHVTKIGLVKTTKSTAASY